MSIDRLRLVVASANKDKAAEIRDLLSAALGAAVELIDRPSDVPDVEETGSTLEENARLKAAALCAATGIASVADDTGLEVEALDGAPGVYSARFASDDATYGENVALLLEKLAGSKNRRPRFRTVALVVFANGEEIVAEGSVDGEITDRPIGDSGFGYDPIFRPALGDGRTFAQLTAGEKHDVSHRGEAFRSLARKLVIHLGTAP